VIASYEERGSNGLEDGLALRAEVVDRERKKSSAQQQTAWSTLLQNQRADHLKDKICKGKRVLLGNPKARQPQ
jgi:hypothetical protein